MVESISRPPDMDAAKAEFLDSREEEGGGRSAASFEANAE